jgi:hypothetical protein
MSVASDFLGIVLMTMQSAFLQNLVSCGRRHECGS